MRESDHTSWLRKKLASELRARTFKHQETFNAGWPDLEVFIKGSGASYIEVKRSGRDGKVRPTPGDFPGLQWGTLLWIAEYVPAVYAIFLEDERRFLVVPPSEFRPGEGGFEVLPGDINSDFEMLSMILLGYKNERKNWRKIIK
jgi:hypothetical protein